MAKQLFVHFYCKWLIGRHIQGAKMGRNFYRANGRKSIRNKPTALLKILVLWILTICVQETIL